MSAEFCVPPARPRLFYVIGPSGAGKDSLLAYARPRVAGRPLAFAHRYITRPASAGGENHVALSEAEFAARALAGCFALTWSSHGLLYGIGCEVEDWLQRGLSVVVNGSREHLPQAASRFPAMIPILVSVHQDELRRRLEARGRETAEGIAERLRRASAFPVHHPALVQLDNSGPLEQAGEHLVHLLRGEA